MEAATKPDNSIILNQARTLVAELESGNDSVVGGLIEELGQMREQTLFQELGKMTRQLHDSLTGFALDSRMQSLAESDIPDAKARLNHVISMTEESANKTLSAVENTLPIAEQVQNSANDLHTKWERFRNKDMNVDEFRSMSNEIDDFLNITISNAGQIHDNLSEMMMAQGFQDLTGQIIRRVITLVTEVEGNLVDLIRLSGGLENDMKTSTKEAESTEDIMKGCGPQVPGIGDADGSVSGQDEVDDLLSSLGF
ncbi:Chemotaxis response - phosphatase CheZ [hydrothermal vent metagenome]|uniref:Protein phosphatase CheZ n=1 Tax=hydrothermal vent metagenome TaxID=652676 RepID=A0A3B0ZN21_9ZZZZ